jgi:flagellar motor switch protein FliG
VRKVLVNALGDEKANSLMDRIRLGGQRKGLEALKWMDSRAVAELIRNEHPQIIAIVLSYLEADQGAEVLGFLPENTRSDLIVRVATLDGVQPSALSELDEMMDYSGRTRAGHRRWADPRSRRHHEPRQGRSSNTIMTDLAKVMNSCRRDQDLMFIFDDLSKVDDRGIQGCCRCQRTNC